MAAIKKLLGQTALYGLSSIVGRLLNYLLVPLYARTLSVADNGILNEWYAYAGVLLVFFSFRMESAFFRYGTPEADRRAAYNSGLVALLAVSGLLTLLAFLFTPQIAGWMRYADRPEFVRMFALILALDCLSELPYARLRMEERPLRFVAGKLLHISVNILLNLFWLLYCPRAHATGATWVGEVWSPEIGVGYVFLSNLIASAVVLLYLGPHLWGFWRAFDGVLLEKMLRYAAPLIVVQLAGVSNQLLDRLLLRRLLPGSDAENLVQLGIYGNNFKLAMLIAIFTQAYRYAAEPFFFKQAGDPNAPETLAKATRAFAIFGAIGVAGVLLGLDMLKHLLTPDYFEGLKVLPPLLMANLLLGIYYNISVWYRLRDKTSYGAWITLAALALTLFANLLLTPRIGYMGAALAAMASSAFMCWAAWYWGQKYYPTPYPWKDMALYSLIPFGLYAALTWLKSAFDVLWLGSVAGAALFAGFVAWVIRREKIWPDRLAKRFGL